MKTKIQIFLLLLAVPVVLSAQVKPPAQSGPIAITHVTVIDATGAAAQPDMTVVVRGNRITEIGKKVGVPGGAKVVDGTGKYLIPGLWDMHIHIHRHDENVLLLANGVTGVRLMGGVPEYHKMQKEIESGDLFGPRYTIASRLIDGIDATGRKLLPPAPGDTAGELAEWQAMENGGLPRSYQVETEAQAREAVAKSKTDGAEFIKIHDDLTRDGFFNLVNASKAAGFIYVGHVPDGVSDAEASNSGMKSIEHLRGLLLANSSQEDQLRKETLEANEQAGDQRTFQLYDIEKRAVDTYSADKANALIALFVKNHTWQCPTIMPEGSLKQQIATHPEWMKYLPVSLQKRWAQQANRPDPPPYMEAVYRRGDEEIRREVGMLQKAGVGILAGEDVGGAGKWAGFSLHENLQEEVVAGLTPMEALQTATINAARFMGKDKDMGTIQKGKLADLVLLDANPLDDIHNTMKINSVVVNGRLLDRPAIDKMMSDVLAMNSTK
jgi:imidazolonepropionase-like amidohydrolase